MFDFWKNLIACPAGVAAYGLLWLYSLVIRPGDAFDLPACAKRIMTHFFPEVAVDAVTVRVRAKIKLPGGLRGITIRRSIYLTLEEFDECNLDHMRLLLHEFVHVEQYRRLGAVAQACQYGIGVAQHWNYEDNPMEVEAREFVDDHDNELRTLRDECCDEIRRSSGPGRSGSWDWILWG